MNEQYTKVGLILPTKEHEGSYVIKFARIAWLLYKNDYWKEYGEVHSSGKGIVPKYNIFCDGRKIGLALPQKTKDEKKPYLILIKKRDRFKVGIAGRQRRYYIFDVDDDFNPKLNSSVTYRISSNYYAK
jgi:hypothetical protein